MTFRYSQLSTAQNCTTKYKLVYLDKVQHGQLEPDHFAFGTAMHLAIQSHFEGNDPQMTFDMYWKSLNPDNYKWARYSYDDHAAMAKEFIRKFLKMHAQHFETLYIEKDIAFEVAGFSMTGRVDWIGKYKGVLTLPDWKTSGSTFDVNKILYDGQLWLYGYGVKQALDLDIKQVMYLPFIKGTQGIQKPIIREYTLDRAKFAIDNEVKVMQDLVMRQEKNFWTRNTQSCGRCEYLTHCMKENT